MAVRTPERHDTREWGPPRYAPRARMAVAVGLLAALAWLANGRPIPAGDTRPGERVAASLIGEGNLALDEYDDVGPPFTRTVDGRRVSIYPVLSAVLAAPVFALAGRLFALDELGLSLAGKLAAVLFSACATGLLFLALGRRHGESGACAASLWFALGTSVWSTSQALWQHPAALMFLALAVWMIVRAEEDDAWAGRVGLPLSLAVAARHADAALVAAVALAVVLRWPRRAPALAAWALPALLFLAVYQWWAFGAPWRHGFSDATAVRFSAPWGVGHLGLLFSPAKGLLVFTPLVLAALAGLVRVFRSGERALAATVAAGVLAHWLFVGRWSEWHGGASYGPRLMTDALPLLWLFVPEGLVLLGRAGTALAVFSVAVQALGAFAYDLRWERLHARGAALAEDSGGVPATETRAAPPGVPLWDPFDTPLWLHARERVLKPAWPALREGRLLLREHPVVLSLASGSRLSFERGHPTLSGADPTLGAVHLQRGARVEGGRLRLDGRWDALFMRVRPEVRLRRLEVRVRGRGQGTLYVGERSFWQPVTRWSAYPMQGAWRVRHPYHYPTSNGSDVLVSLGKTGGTAWIDSVAVLAPQEPDEVLKLP